jgi:hypothetical protein
LSPARRRIRWIGPWASSFARLEKAGPLGCQALEQFHPANAGFSARIDMTAEELAVLICASLQRSTAVEVDGLGVFSRDDSGLIRLRHGNRPRIFVAYALEDLEIAEKLFRSFEAADYAPWLDRQKLLPGQNWPQGIQEAIENSDFFVPCFSRNSVRKRGGFQAEIRHALECGSRMPLDDVFMIPVRLDDCRVPARIQRETQYVDLFPDWDAGLERIIEIIETQRCGRRV